MRRRHIPHEASFVSDGNGDLHQHSTSGVYNPHDAKALNEDNSTNTVGTTARWLRMPSIAGMVGTLPTSITAAAGAVVGAAAAKVRAHTDLKKTEGAANCHGCSTAFSMRVWRYPCPLCGRSFCGACMPNTHRHATPGHSDAPAIICMDCFVNTVRFLFVDLFLSPSMTFPFK